MKEISYCLALELFHCLHLLFRCVPLWTSMRLHGKKLQNATNVKLLCYYLYSCSDHFFMNVVETRFGLHFFHTGVVFGLASKPTIQNHFGKFTNSVYAQNLIIIFMCWFRCSFFLQVKCNNVYDLLFLAPRDSKTKSLGIPHKIYLAELKYMCLTLAHLGILGIPPYIYLDNWASYYEFLGSSRSSMVS